MSDGDVIQFPVTAGDRRRNADDDERETLPVRTGHKTPYCLHDHTTIYENRRELVCRDCGATLDPIDFLVRFARQSENEVSRAQRLRHEIDWLTLRVEELKREERNTKARLRTARRAT